MGKAVHSDVLDGALDVIKNNVNEMNANSQEPATRTEAITTYMLADVAMATTDFTVGAGDGGGDSRKVAVAQKTGVTVDNTGTANHVSLVDATRLLYVTTATAQALTAGNTMTFQTWDIEIASPT